MLAAVACRAQRETHTVLSYTALREAGSTALRECKSMALPAQLRLEHRLPEA